MLRDNLTRYTALSKTARPAGPPAPRRRESRVVPNAGGLSRFRAVWTHSIFIWVRVHSTVPSSPTVRLSCSPSPISRKHARSASRIFTQTAARVAQACHSPLPAKRGARLGFRIARPSPRHRRLQDGSHDCLSELACRQQNGVRVASDPEFRGSDTGQHARREAHHDREVGTTGTRITALQSHSYGHRLRVVSHQTEPCCNPGGWWGGTPDSCVGDCDAR